jgi:hypothetical protein
MKNQKKGGKREKVQGLKPRTYPLTTQTLSRSTRLQPNPINWKPINPEESPAITKILGSKS